MPKAKRMPPIPTVTDLQIAFPVARDLPPLPAFHTLPQEFQDETHPACRAIEGVFFGRPAGKMTPRFPEMTDAEGQAVARLIRAHLKCFDHKHEHKIAGCAALLDQWFEVAL